MVERRTGDGWPGAVQIWDPDRPGEPRTPRITAVTRDEVGATKLRETIFAFTQNLLSGDLVS